MKKILSLLLVGVMVFSMIPAAYAQNVYENPDENTDMGTTVAATGELTTVNEDGTVSHDVSYTIKVPAKMAPGDEGTVYLEGYWPSDATVKVTADASVDMVNDITNANQKTLAVTFTPIELAGNNEGVAADDEVVSVADIENALFGSWSGVFHYNVEYVAGSGNTGDSGTTEPSDPDTGDGEEANLFTFTIDGTEYQAESGAMTWEQWVESEYYSEYYKDDFVLDPDSHYLLTADGKHVLNKNGNHLSTLSTISLSSPCTIESGPCTL